MRSVFGVRDMLYDEAVMTSYCADTFHLYIGGKSLDFKMLEPHLNHTVLLLDTPESFFVDLQQSIWRNKLAPSVSSNRLIGHRYPQIFCFLRVFVKKSVGYWKPMEKPLGRLDWRYRAIPDQHR